MARYRKIDVCMWGDEKFRALSSPPPNGRDCWIHLLTNRETTNIPGVYRTYPETLARDLGWPVEAYLEAFREASSKGMAEADWKAGLVFIPGAIKRNPPESPNVIKNWRETWSELPECALKHKAHRHLKAFAEGLSEGFRKAFAEALPKGSADPSRNQEQEQEQEQDPPVAPQGGRTDRPDGCEPAIPGGTAKRATKRETKATGRAAQRGDALRVLDVLNAARARVIPGCRQLRATDENLHHIADRLAAGATLDDCTHVVEVREAEVRAGGDPRWFDAVTPFRPDQFAKSLAQTSATAARPLPAADPPPARHVPGVEETMKLLARLRVDDKGAS